MSKTPHCSHPQFEVDSNTGNEMAVMVNIKKHESFTCVVAGSPTSTTRNLFASSQRVGSSSFTSSISSVICTTDCCRELFASVKMLTLCVKVNVPKNNDYIVENINQRGMDPTENATITYPYLLRVSSLHCLPITY